MDRDRDVAGQSLIAGGVTAWRRADIAHANGAPLGVPLSGPSRKRKMKMTSKDHSSTMTVASRRGDDDGVRTPILWPRENAYGVITGGRWRHGGGGEAMPPWPWSP